MENAIFRFPHKFMNCSVHLHFSSVSLMNKASMGEGQTLHQQIHQVF